MPKKAVQGDARRAALNMKTTEAIRQKLEGAAKQSGRTLTHEVEYRLEQSFNQDLVGDSPTALVLRAAGDAIRLYEQITGRRWEEDDTTCREAFNAAVRVIEAVMQPPEQTEDAAQLANRLMAAASSHERAEVEQQVAEARARLKEANDSLLTLNLASKHLGAFMEQSARRGTRDAGA